MSGENLPPFIANALEHLIAVHGEDQVGKTVHSLPKADIAQLPALVGNLWFFAGATDRILRKFWFVSGIGELETVVVTAEFEQNESYEFVRASATLSGQGRDEFLAALCKPYGLPGYQPPELRIIQPSD